MRSVAYIFGAKPRNLDDCLDFSLRVKPLAVSVDLSISEVVTEMYILEQFIARFLWSFPDVNISCDKVFGICFAHNTEDRQLSSVSEANRRLQACLEKIELSHIEVLGKQERFHCSLTETCG